MFHVFFSRMNDITVMFEKLELIEKQPEASYSKMDLTITHESPVSEKRKIDTQQMVSSSNKRRKTIIDDSNHRLKTHGMVYTSLTNNDLKKLVKIRPGPQRCKMLRSFKKCQNIDRVTRKCLQHNYKLLSEEIKYNRNINRISLIRYKRILTLLRNFCFQETCLQTNDRLLIIKYFNQVIEKIDYMIGRFFSGQDVSDLIERVDQLNNM